MLLILLDKDKNIRYSEEIVDYNFDNCLKIFSETNKKE
jgi:hypothetical protein